MVCESCCTFGTSLKLCVYNIFMGECILTCNCGHWMTEEVTCSGHETDQSHKHNDITDKWDEAEETCTMTRS